MHFLFWYYFTFACIFLTCILIYDHILNQTFFNFPFSEFQDIFDVEHFITSLRDEVRILRELPPRVKRRVELGMFHSMPPISWSDISYYRNKVRCLFHYLPFNSTLSEKKGIEFKFTLYRYFL